MADVKRLGAYVIPGPATNPHAAVVEAECAERLGLGSIWESELQGPVKDAATICGYLGHATEQIRIGTSITHFTLRHPIILASWGATMQMLTGGRFEFGFGRSSPILFDTTGATPPTLQIMEDYAAILRQLWAGETVTYDGPAGRYPKMEFLSAEMPPEVTPPPLLLAAVGPRTLELVGRVFDGVFLHPFLTPEAVHRSRRIIHDAADQAGRDPASVRIYHELVTAPDMTTDEVDLAVRARLAAYLTIPGVENLIPAANGWDADRLGPFRETLARSLAANAAASEPLKGRAVLIEAARQIPDAWIDETAAIGSPTECAAAFDRFFDAGADEIILHGVTTDRLGPTTEAYAAR